MNTMIRRRLARSASTLALAAACGSLTGCYVHLGWNGSNWNSGDLDEKRYEVFEFEHPGSLSLDASSPFGDVSIAPSGVSLPKWAEEAEAPAEFEGVLVVARVRAVNEFTLADVDFNASWDGGLLTLDGEGPDWPDEDHKEYGWDIAVRYHDSLEDVTANTGFGDIFVRGAEGDYDVRSGFGDLEIEVASGSHGKVNLKSGYGDIEVDGLGGAASITTGFGDIELVISEHQSDPILAKSGFGDLDVEVLGVPPGPVKGSSGMGSVRVDTPSGTGPADELTWKFGTGFGDVRVRQDP